MKNALAIAAVALALLPIAKTSADPVEDGIYVKVPEGALVRAADDARVFMVDRGVLRHITGNAFGRLYRDFGVVTTIVEIPEHLVGEPLGTGTRLVRAKGTAHVWLIDNAETKRHVSDVPVFDRYRFDWGHVQLVDANEIDFLPIGPRLE